MDRKQLGLAPAVNVGGLANATRNYSEPGEVRFRSMRFNAPGIQNGSHYVDQKTRWTITRMVWPSLVKPSVRSAFVAEVFGDDGFSQQWHCSTPGQRDHEVVEGVCVALCAFGFVAAHKVGFPQREETEPDAPIAYGPLRGVGCFWLQEHVGLEAQRHPRTVNYLMAERFYEIRRYVLDHNWSPVIAPIQCNYVFRRNAGAVPVEQSTNPSDPTSFDDIQPGVQDMLNVPSLGSPRFYKDDVVLYLRVADGQVLPGDVRIHFIM